jgi:hypothetical protein
MVRRGVALVPRIMGLAAGDCNRFSGPALLVKGLPHARIDGGKA